MHGNRTMDVVIVWFRQWTIRRLRLV